MIQANKKYWIVISRTLLKLL